MYTVYLDDMYTSTLLCIYLHIIFGVYTIAIYFKDLCMLSRCTSCHGRKRVIGLGNIEKECPGCKGIGWVTVVDVVTPSVTPPTKVNRRREKHG